MQSAVLDASGRIPQAVTQENFHDLGMYDQCLKIHEKANGVVVKGKYCYGGLVIPLEDLLVVFDGNFYCSWL